MTALFYYLKFYFEIGFIKSGLLFFTELTKGETS